MRSPGLFVVDSVSMGQMRPTAPCKDLEHSWRTETTTMNVCTCTRHGQESARFLSRSPHQHEQPISFDQPRTVLWGHT